MEEFEAISVGASKEHSLEKAMQKMEDDWDPIVFITTLYRDTGNVWWEGRSMYMVPPRSRIGYGR